MAMVPSRSLASRIPSSTDSVRVELDGDLLPPRLRPGLGEKRCSLSVYSGMGAQ